MRAVYRRPINGSVVGSLQAISHGKFLDSTLSGYDSGVCTIPGSALSRATSMQWTLLGKVSHWRSKIPGFVLVVVIGRHSLLWPSQCPDVSVPNI